MKRSSKNRRISEPLVTCATMNAMEKVREAVASSDSMRLCMACQSSDFVADEVKYHKSCYQNATRPKSGPNLEMERNCNDSTAMQVALDALFSDVERDIIKGRKVRRMVDLCCDLKQHFQTPGGVMMMIVSAPTC